MNLDEIIKTLGIFGISATSFTAIVIFLGKKYIELIAEKKLEETKNELLKQASEFQIKTSALHNECVEAIKTIYSKLSELNDAVFILVLAGKGDESEQKQLDEFYRLYYDLRIEFNRNRIFFNKELSALINDTIQKVHSSLFNFKNIIETTEKIKKEINSELISYYRTTKREDWENAAKIIEKDVPILLERLESEFRNLLGVK